MKLNFLFIFVFPSVVFCGEINLKNDTLVAEKQAEKAWISSSSYYSNINYSNDLSSANGVSALKETLIKKLNSDTYLEKEKSKRKNNIKNNR